MEIVIILAIIIGYCLILNVGLNYIILGTAGLLCLFSVFLILFFIFCFICLLFSKRKEARFIRFEKGRNGKYQIACYEVCGEEYLCVFPSEAIMKDKLYKRDKVYHVMLNNKMRKVFDRFAITTSVIGFVFGLVLVVGTIYLFSAY